jgi:hypothetical protein
MVNEGLKLVNGCPEMGHFLSDSGILAGTPCGYFWRDWSCKKGRHHKHQKLWCTEALGGGQNKSQCFEVRTNQYNKISSSRRRPGQGFLSLI